MKKHKLENPYYPIVYVRGYAMTPSEREETFHDTYYGFATTSVEKRQAPPPDYFEADVFEGQMIRLMKLKKYRYADAVNEGEQDHDNPSRSIWICRFYDQDVMREKLRSIESHAEDLRKMICETIPGRLARSGVELGKLDTPGQKYKVILMAHSMGGLVCRTLIQNLLPDPKRWIHRLVTFGTPHKGIELGRIPDFLENFITTRLNPFDANIFKEKRMRKYLKLKPREEVHSLGSTPFPVKRCLCLIGSDYHSYNVVQKVTGDFSDGLVKQDRAYIVSGAKPPSNTPYPNERRAFWANVHRAHSGWRGIVNSYESFENVHRFLFGNIRAEITLENLLIKTPQEPRCDYFYDIEFTLSILGTNTYLHRRQQDPCENAVRLARDKIPAYLLLHTAFMNSKLKTHKNPFSSFSLNLRIVERAVKHGLLWDRDYPDKQIFNETLEIRVGDADPTKPGDEVQYRWFSDGAEWEEVEPVKGVFRFPLRGAGSLSGQFAVRAGPWPDASTED
jgi:hypothetical protein